jgi:hypothetical protein
MCLAVIVGNFNLLLSKILWYYVLSNYHLSAFPLSQTPWKWPAVDEDGTVEEHQKLEGALCNTKDLTI